MVEAQETMRKQEQADEAKSKLCDSIQKHKAKIAGLKLRIDNLEYIDPELYRYIRRLEYVQDGIWCNECAAAKQIHHSVSGEILERVPSKLSRSPLESFRERVGKPGVVGGVAANNNNNTPEPEIMAKSTSKFVPVVTPSVVIPQFPNTETSVMQATINDLVRRITALENNMPITKVSLNPPPVPRASVTDFLGLNKPAVPEPNRAQVNPFAAVINDGFVAESSAVRPFTLPTGVNAPKAIDLFSCADFSQHD